MLDYDDFNSQHSTRAMQVVLEETCDATGYPAELAETLIQSLERQDIYLGSTLVGRCAGTLMSGHRATTYFNSVLNMAYLMVVLGDEYVLSHPSLHVGDDVYLGATDYADAGYIVERIIASPLRMNRSKQSVGHVSTEFLRVANTARDSYGYLARAVAGTVAGNWYSDRRLNAAEALTTMVTNARTLANRSRQSIAPLLLVSAVKRSLASASLDEATVSRLLTGEWAVNDGPQFISSGRHRSLPVTPVFTYRDQEGYGDLPCLASTSFLSKCASPLEVDTLTAAGISVKGQMVMSSWSKSVDFSGRPLETLRVGPLRSWEAVGSIPAEDALTHPKPHGVLLKYPLLVLAKSRLPERVLRTAVAAAGGNASARDIALEAWGEYSHGCIVRSVLSYSDAASLGRRVWESVLTSNRRCFV